MVHLCVFSRRGVAPLAARNLSTHCHVSLTALSAYDSMHKHPCSTLVMCTRMFAICPPLLCYPQHSALLRGLGHTFGLCWSRPSASLQFKPVLQTQTPKLDSHASLVREALQYKYGCLTIDKSK